MESTTLKNGIMVDVEDKTTVLSGDLHMVHLEFTISIALGEGDEELRRYCNGNRLSRTQIFKRAAVHERELEEVRRSIKESYFRSTTRYLEHPRFIERFKQKSLEDFKEEEEKKFRAAVVYEE
jgi:hypothetical protein